jgi:histone deacetylase 1/2
MDNANSPEYLKRITEEVVSNLRHTGSPSVQMTDVPRTSLMNGMDSDAEDEEDDLDADEHPDVRNTQRRMDQRIERDEEFDESDDEEINEANGIRRQPGAVRQRNIGIMDYTNPHADLDIDIDEDGEAVLVDPREEANGDITMGDGSREENQRIANEKADAALSPSPTPESSVVNSPSAHQSAVNGALSRHSSADVPDAEEEADVEDMEVDDYPNEDVEDGSNASDYSDEALAPAGVTVVPDTAATSPSPTGDLTPPESPVTAQPAADTTIIPAEDVEMADGEPSPAEVVVVAQEERLPEPEAEKPSAETAAETAKEDETS